LGDAQPSTSFFVQNSFPKSIVSCFSLPVPDDPPRNLRAVGTDITVVTVYWKPVWNETVNGICLGYQLEVFDITGHRIKNYTTNSSNLSLEVTGLEIWANYTFRVAAFTVKGLGKWSSMVQGSTNEECTYYL